MGGQSTGSKLEREVTALLRKAGWKVAETRNSRKYGGDLIASRLELGRERRYAIECVQEIDNRTLRDQVSRFRNWIRQSKQPFAEFDEFWLVGYSAPKLKGGYPEDDRHFRALELGELRALLMPSSRMSRNKARTKIGKSIEANHREITLAVASLVLQLEDIIKSLDGERPNSTESITTRDEKIQQYRSMREELERIRAALPAFLKGEEKEAHVVKLFKTFGESVGAWWDKKYDVILSRTFELGLFTAAVGVCSLAGAGGNMAAVVSAVLVGGKPVAQGLKGLLP